MKPCPACSRRIQDAATKCHYCGAIVRQPAAPGGVQGRGGGETAKTAGRARPELTKGARVTGTILVLLVVLALTIWWIS